MRNKPNIMNMEIDSTSEKIIAATLRVLQKEGFEKATTKKISAEAGVNEVTIFRKFENKKNLVETTKNYYLQLLMDTVEDIFDYDEDEEIEEYLKISFYGILNLSDEDFSILRIAMGEVSTIPDKKHLISQITDVILDKLEEYFKSQKDKGVIRDIDTRSLAVMCFSVIFQSVILWKVYDKDMTFESNHYADDILDILFDGIKV